MRPAWTEAIAVSLTGVILLATLIAAIKNLRAFKDAERVKRTVELFQDYHTRTYAQRPGSSTIAGIEVEQITPFVAISTLLSEKLACGDIYVITTHNFLEMVAALHFQGLLDDDLFFDSFATTILEVYTPLTANLERLNTPITQYSRIPLLLSNAAAFISARAQKPLARHPKGST